MLIYILFRYVDMENINVYKYLQNFNKVEENSIKHRFCFSIPFRYSVHDNVQRILQNFKVVIHALESKNSVRYSFYKERRHFRIGLLAFYTQIYKSYNSIQ